MSATLIDLIDDVFMQGPELWPNETIMRLMGCVGEEAGEICRAINKRDSGYKMTHEEWTENLRIECGQMIITLICIANQEGFDLEQAGWDAWLELLDRPQDQRDGPPKQTE